jgi:hypothetical protein
VAGWLGHRLRWGRPHRARARLRGEEELAVVELPSRRRRVRVRIGELHGAAGSDALVLVLRTPEIELRAAWRDDESSIVVERAAGRLRLKRSRRRRRPGSGSVRRDAGGDASTRTRERIGVDRTERARFLIDALEHPGLCDRDARLVLARARSLAGVLGEP